MQSIEGTSNDMGTHIGGTSLGDAKKKGWKADSVKSIENKKSYKTKEDTSIYSRKFSVRYEQNIKCRCKVKRSSD